MLGGENQLLQDVLWSPYMCHGTHARMCTRTHIQTHRHTRCEILKYRISFDQSAMKRNEGLKYATHVWTLKTLLKQQQQQNNHRHGSRNRRQRAQILNHQFKAERLNWKQARPQALRAHPLWHTFFSEATLPKPPQAMLPAGAQGFQCLRLWRTFFNQTTTASSDSFYPWMAVG